MNLEQRIDLMVRLGEHLVSADPEWEQVKQHAFLNNGWFTKEFAQLAATNIAENFLQKQKLQAWAGHYHLDDNINSRNIGIVMAGNIPMVGFHDLLSVFICGHKQNIKLSSKDDVLMKYVVSKLISLDLEAAAYFTIADNLKDLDAYITTGSNNTSRYFEYYFGKYPSIIRKNKTSVAILVGNETNDQFEKLADDICIFFGLGCRNVTKIYVPEGYNFENFLKSFSAYDYFKDHKKYRNNYDYYLTIQIMNTKFYMTNDLIIMLERDEVFSPVSQINYGFYKDKDELIRKLSSSENIQCIVGTNKLDFGKSQQPGLFDYADGEDTMAFLLSL
ncbi:acyl-CoA reductase [soil metagenome]